MQTLLAERFQALYHRETRQVTVYRFRIAKDGPKLEVVEDGGPNGGVAPVRPSVFAALQGIGLKLDTAKGPRGTAGGELTLRAKTAAIMSE